MSVLMQTDWVVGQVRIEFEELSVQRGDEAGRLGAVQVRAADCDFHLGQFSSSASSVGDSVHYGSN